MFRIFRSLDTNKSYCVFLFVCSCILYANTLKGAYVWDDRAAILGNSDVTQKNTISELFMHDFWGQDIRDNMSHKSYRPITTLSFRANHALHGLSALGFHLANVLIYASCVVLTYFVCKQWLSSIESARVASALYCFHPVHVEAVASLVGRADSLCGFFFMASMLAYSASMHNWRQNHDGDDVTCTSSQHAGRIWGISQFLFSLILAIAASLTKEIGVTILGILVIVEIADNIQDHLNELKKAKSIELKLINSPSGSFSSGFRICFAGLMKASTRLFSPSQIRISLVVSTLAILSAMRVRINGPQSLYEWSHLENHISHLPTFLERTYSYAQTHFWYFMKLFYPRHLCFDYGYACIPTIHTIFDLRNVFPLVAYAWILGMLYYAIAYASVSILLGIGLLLIPLVPALNILFPVGTTLAERLLFIPSTGFCMVAGEALTFYFSRDNIHTEVIGDKKDESTKVKNRKGTKKLSFTKYIYDDKNGKNGLYAFTLCICLLFGVRVITRNSDWNSESQIYESALYVCPLSAKALTNYAVLHMDSGNLHNAAAAAISSVEIFDDQSAAWLNAGVVQQRLGYFARSAWSFEEALTKNRASAKMWGYLGSTFYEWSLETNALNEPLNGSVSELRSRACDAMDQGFADGFQPPATLHSRGSLALDMQDPQKAIECFRKALDLTATARAMDPDVPQSDLVHEAFTLNQLGNVYSSIGKQDDALAAFMQGLKLNPTAVSLLANTGSTLRALNRLDEARALLKQAVKIEEQTSGSPSVAVINNLALVELDAGFLDSAQALLYRAKSIYEKSSEVNDLLSLKDNDGHVTHLRTSDFRDETIPELIENNIERVRVLKEKQL